jgi:hypothetical protein
LLGRLIVQKQFGVGSLAYVLTWRERRGSTPLLATRSVVIPRLGLGIHEFVSAAPRLPYRNSWMPSLKLGMTIQFGSNTVQSHLPS